MIATSRRLFVFLVLAVTSVQAVKAAAPEPVAIVYETSGEASRLVPGRSRQPVHLLDRLAAGTAIELAAGSRLALAFLNGRRYEISGPARATLGKDDLAARSGGVRALPSVPPLPRLAPIAEDDRPGAKAGAVRIRREEIDSLSPRDGAATLADATSLRFQTADGAARHQVEIEDARGTLIFRVVTEASAVNVPTGILASGGRYHWTVKALDRPGPVVRGEAEFVTLPRKTAEARERLRKAVEAAGNDGSRALLAAVDHDLGLTNEAHGRRMAAGAEVESLTPGSTGERAGLQPGDTILSWSCAASPPAFPQPSGGTVRSPYDLVPLEIEEAPRRAVILRGTRGDQKMTWTLMMAEWGLEVRPVLPADLSVLYLEGRARTEAGDVTAAERSWRSAAESARTAGDGRLAAWFLDRLARALAEPGMWPEADAAYGEALRILERESESAAAAQLLRAWGKTFWRRGGWDEAVERFQKALELDRRSASKSLAEARTLNGLGVTAARRGDYSTAEAFLRQALAIQEELVPGTAEITGSLNNLGILARRRGDLTAAEEYLTRGEELQRRLASDSADHALFFQNLGNLAHDRGDLERAAGFHRKALAIFEKTAPEGDGVAGGLHNLAIVAMERGDLAAADDLLRRSLALKERAAEELEVTDSLINLGNVASRRGDLDAAELYYRRALAIQEKLSPDGPEAANSLASLGFLVALRSDFTTARTYLRRALAIDERLAPDSLEVALDVENLGRLEIDSGDLATAEELLRRALTIFEKKAPESLQTAGVLVDLGEVATRRGHLTKALELHRRALDLQRKLAPGSTSEAEALYLMGRAERRAGRHEEGTRDLCRAIDVLDRQRIRLGGTPEARTSFEASLGDYYYACLEGLIELGRPAEAFHALERGRARSFLALLAERDLRPSGLPPELATERRKVNADYDRVQSQLARLSPAETTPRSNGSRASCTTCEPARRRSSPGSDGRRPAPPPSRTPSRSIWRVPAQPSTPAPCSSSTRWDRRGPGSSSFIPRARPTPACRFSRSPPGQKPCARRWRASAAS